MTLIDAACEAWTNTPTVLRADGWLDCLMHDAEDRASCILCCCKQTEPLKWKMWLVCNKALKKSQQNVKRENLCRTNTKAHLTHIRAPKTQISYRQTRACYSRQGWKTDTVSQRWWCTWQLLVVLHVTYGLLNLIVWCVPVVRRHYSRALVNSSPGSNYKWAVCICMTPGIWAPLNQSHTGYSRCRLSV